MSLFKEYGNILLSPFYTIMAHCAAYCKITFKVLECFILVLTDLLLLAEDYTVFHGVELSFTC
jgi:hypothetical protein